MKVMWIVAYDVRPNRYEFVQCPFDRLKDARQYVEEHKQERLFKYWQIIRQEYDGIRYGERKVVENN